MAGSSKGGTCAIYFGLKHHATEIFASACQYHIGDYLNTTKHLPIIKAMMGETYGSSDVEKLNDMVPNMISKNKDSKTKVHLYYSKDEHTYNEHIIDLLQDFDRARISYDSTIDSYINHGENGVYFSKYLKEQFS